MRPIAIGIDDFKKVRESNSLYIDKTLFIKDIIDDTCKAIEFIRPRRFGKSLNMSMLNFYFNNLYDNKYLFDGLNISKCEDKYLSEMNKYPVISLSLKDCKKSTYLEFISSFKELIVNLYSNYKYLLESSLIDEVEKEYFNRCLNKTGGVDLLKDTICKNNTSLINEFNRLLDSNYVYNVNLDFNMNLTDLNYERSTVWTLFMLSGYLTVDSSNDLENLTLRIPNLEIRKNLESICKNWFKKEMKGSNLVVSLVDGALETFKRELERIVLGSFSYYDVAGINGENFYHAFVMGLLYSANDVFEITSNPESGYGRYDLLLEPKDGSCKYAYIIEFKSITDNDFSKTMEKAFKQIEEKKYANSFKDYDFTKIVIVFKGKEIMIETRK